MRCSGCNAPINKGEKFCRVCGQAVSIKQAARMAGPANAPAQNAAKAKGPARQTANTPMKPPSVPNKPVRATASHWFGCLALAGLIIVLATIPALLVIQHIAETIGVSDEIITGDRAVNQAAPNPIGEATGIEPDQTEQNDAVLIEIQPTPTESPAILPDAVPDRPQSAYGALDVSTLRTELSGAISPSNTVFYSNAAYLEDYGIYSGEDSRFGFYYPLYLYKNVTVYDEADDLAVVFESDGPDELLYTRTKRNEDESMPDAAVRLYEEWQAQMTEPDRLVYTDDEADGFGRFIITGYANPEQTAAAYVLVTIWEDYVDTMLISYQSFASAEDPEALAAAYMVDTLYRGCAFGGSTYEPRTYEAFVAGTMGRKR